MHDTLYARNIHIPQSPFADKLPVLTGLFFVFANKIPPRRQFLYTQIIVFSAEFVVFGQTVNGSKLCVKNFTFLHQFIH